MSTDCGGEVVGVELLPFEKALSPLLVLLELLPLLTLAVSVALTAAAASGVPVI